ncbi:MAG: hypothetical protein ACR2NP_22655 [Pirellulaceae bacterium]
MNCKSLTSGHESKRLWLCLLFAAAATMLPSQYVVAQDNALRIIPEGQLQPLTNSPVATAPPTTQASPLPPATLPVEAANVQSQTRPWLQATDSGAKEIDVPAMISKLAMSTMFVLCLCVAGLVIFKKFRGGMLTGITKNTGSTTSNDLAVEATLKLGAAGYLQIVRAGEMRLVVACDSSGIKSLQPIGSLFAQELEQEEVKSNQRGIRRTESASHIREPVPGFMQMRGVPDFH